jgi:putative transposase
MRGRYNGCRMSVYGSIVPGVGRLAKLLVELSKEARRRLKWFDYYYSHGCNARLTCRHFDISPQTFYRWKRRYDPHHLKSLENRSCRPKRARRPTWSPELVEAVLKLREQYPRWGKDKLVILVGEQGFATSTSTVGRILRWLKDRGVLREPLRMARAVRKRGPKRPYAARKPRGYKAKEPGDIVEVDTLDIRPLPGVILKQFTARDIVSRWDTLEVHSRATANIAAGFLDSLEARMPFPIRAIQVDGGSEFMAQFEEECQQRKILLFVLPPRSPKLNGHVERANRTHSEEFYEVVDSDFTVADLIPKLLGWEQIYNTVRPHQALGYLTPLQFLQQYYGKEEVSLRY